ncbi:MAG: cation diffusion facilitator family transporter [Myxococcaceae bacterium]|nr:cation diffusion facilitator family transporter [Myxococcaceae bacterium]
MAGDTSHVFQSLAANGAIVVAKGIAAVLTGSGAMLAETIHSAADCANQLLLLVGIKKADKPADDQHPLGYGRSVYFWSFLVAMLLFSLGGMFSIYEGVHKLQHPEPVERLGIAVSILVFSLLIEGWATIGNLKEMKKRRGDTPLFKYLRDTKDSDLVVIFGENAAAVVGLTCALAALGAAAVTGDGRYDAVGSLLVGIVLVAVAIFLAIEIQSLLIGESADPAIEKAVRASVERHPEIEAMLRLITIQQGPGQVMVAMKLKLKPNLDGAQVVAAINTVEVELKREVPDVKWCFVEPDWVA